MSEENRHHPTPCGCEFCEIVRLRAHVAALEAFICEHGGLLNEWAATWDPSVTKLRLITLRDHIKNKLDQWMKTR